MSNAPLGQKNRPWHARISFRNGESSAQLLVGMPVSVLSSDTSAVISANTAAAAAAHSLNAGVMAGNPNVGEYADVIVEGYVPAARVLLMTKAASTDAWASYSAIAVGDYFTIDTVNNAFQRSGAGGAAAAPPAYVALNSLASATTAASSAYTGTVAASATALTVAMRMFIRNLG